MTKTSEQNARPTHRGQRGTIAHLDVAKTSETRITQIKRWYIDQAIGSTRAVALLNITLTEDAQIQTHGVGIEPEIAAAMLDELDRLRRLLVDALPTKALQPTSPVIRLHIARTKQIEQRAVVR